MPVPTLDIKGKGAARFAETFVARYRDIKEEQRVMKVRKFEAEQETKLFKARQSQQFKIHEEEMDLREAQLKSTEEARKATEARLAGAEEFKQDFSRFVTLRNEITALITLREAARERDDDVELRRIEGLIKSAEPDYLRLGKELDLFTIPTKTTEREEIPVEKEPVRKRWADWLPPVIGTIGIRETIRKHLEKKEPRITAKEVKRKRGRLTDPLEIR